MLYAASVGYLLSPGIHRLIIAMAATVAVGTAVARVLMINMVRSRLRRELPGYCNGCGYDLTGNESGVCPECGWHTGEEKTKDRLNGDAGVLER